MRRFDQVDVFSPQPLRGNPVAVVHDAGGLSTEQMQRFTRWTNLSEATFLLPPTDRRRTTECASSTPPGSWTSPAIRRWGAATRGLVRAAHRENRI